MTTYTVTDPNERFFLHQGPALESLEDLFGELQTTAQGQGGRQVARGQRERDRCIRQGQGCVRNLPAGKGIATFIDIVLEVSFEADGNDRKPWLPIVEGESGESEAAIFPPAGGGPGGSRDVGQVQVQQAGQSCLLSAHSQRQ